MYVIYKKTPCQHCGGAGTFYEEDPDMLVTYITYPCPRCVGGTVTEEVDADQWLIERLEKFQVRGA